MAGLLAVACARDAPEPAKDSETAAAPVVEAVAEPAGFTDADYEQHLAVLRARLDAAGFADFATHAERPFVVVARLPPDALVERARTVRWAADRLERDFFDRRPHRIVDVFLFGNAEDYESGVRSLTGEAPTTPFGFYSQPHDALFMNIATGGGTLVHEMVHPYVEADCPLAPAWIDEGLGSLFEQCVERDGHLVALTNWRLAQLQESVRDRTVPTLVALTRLSDDEFYGEEHGIHYAQSRYLFYYLQERGLLVTFYEAFRAAAASDPTGYETLLATLAEPDVDDFERRWQAWVMTLHFP